MPSLRRPTHGLWGHRDFMRLWTGQSISEFGTQITGLAIPWLAAVNLHATPFEFSLLTVLGFLPFILFALPAGVWVDRLRRRPILIVGDSARAAILVYIPIAWAGGWLDIGQLLVLTFVFGIFTVFFDVAYQSYLPALVEREALVEGNSKLQSTAAAAGVGGPPVAGLLISAITAPYAIVFDAASFVVSTLFMLRIRREEPLAARAVGASHPKMLPELKEGVRYVLHHPHLKWIAMCTGTANFFGQIAFAIGVLFMQRTLHLGSFWVGFSFAGFGIGSIAGAVTAARFQDLVGGVGRAIWISSVMFGAGGIALPLAHRGYAVPLIFGGALVIGYGGMTYNIAQVSYRQAITPERIQGRMNATMRWIVWGAIPLGGLLGGALGQWTSLRTALWVGAIGGTLAFLPVLLSSVRTIKEIPMIQADVRPLDPAAEGGVVEPTTSPLAGPAPADA
jgi:MFS family permease